ncbi:MAG: hypothetical protein ACRD4R_13845 [Candidatus Acidiferrales bacterium]
MDSNWLHSVRPWGIVFVLLFASILVAPLAHAQHVPPKNEFGIWGAYSANSPDVWGSQGHIQFGAAAFRYGRILFSSPSYNVEYRLTLSRPKSPARIITCRARFYPAAF